MSKQPEKIGLADRVRPNSEAAPWLCEAIAEQDAELRRLRAISSDLLESLKELHAAIRAGRYEDPSHDRIYQALLDGKAAIARAEVEQ